MRVGTQGKGSSREGGQQPAWIQVEDPCGFTLGSLSFLTGVLSFLREPATNNLGPARKAKFALS